MFDLFKKKKSEPVVEDPKVKKPRKSKKSTQSVKSEKDIATEKGDPYVSVIKVTLDNENVGNGEFELDFNEIFVARLYKAGYQGKDDYEVVDKWFTDVCRNVVMENFEQWEANQPMDERPRTIQKKDLGNGKTEVS